MPEIVSTSNRDSQGFSVLVHAPSGSNKTRLAATAGDNHETLILNIDKGLMSLRDEDIPAMDINSMKDMEEALAMLKADTRFKWVCIDDLTELSSICLKEKKALTTHVQQAHGWMQDAILTMIRDLRALNKNIYFISKQMKDTTLQMYGPAMEGSALSFNGKFDICYLFDEVFTIVDKVHEETGAVYRLLQTFRDETYECKDRSGALNKWESLNLQKIHQKILAKR